MGEQFLFPLLAESNDTYSGEGIKRDVTFLRILHGDCWYLPASEQKREENTEAKV